MIPFFESQDTESAFGGFSLDLFGQLPSPPTLTQNAMKALLLSVVTDNRMPSPDYGNQLRES